MNKRRIITVVYATKAVAKIKPEKNSGLNGIRTHDLCDTGAALYQIELSSQLGAGHSVSSIYTHLGDEMIVNIWKSIYLNCGILMDITVVAELVCTEKEQSDWLPEQSKFVYTQR